MLQDPNVERIIEERIAPLKKQVNKLESELEAIKNEVDKSKKLFKKYNWPTIDVTRKSVEETAASILKIYEIKKNR